MKFSVSCSLYSARCGQKNAYGHVRKNWRCLKTATHPRKTKKKRREENKSGKQLFRLGIRNVVPYRALQILAEFQLRIGRDFVIDTNNSSVHRKRKGRASERMRRVNDRARICTLSQRLVTKHRRLEQQHRDFAICVLFPRAQNGWKAPFHNCTAVAK